MAGPEGEGKRNTEEEERESIWSIPTKYKRWYFGFFSLQVIIATVWMIREAIGDQTLGSIPDKAAFVWQGLAPMAITSAAFSLIIIETWAASMVIASWLEETLEKRRQRQIKAAVEKAEKAAEERGLARGRAESQKEWQDWNSRREAAAVAGEEFTEPAPTGKASEQEPGSNE